MRLVVWRGEWKKRRVPDLDDWSYRHRRNLTVADAGVIITEFGGCDPHAKMVLSRRWGGAEFGSEVPGIL